MWQRIQTLYLAIASGLIFSLFFCNIGTVITAGGQSTVGFTEKLPYLLFNIMLLTANLLALILFRFRPLQARVCILAALLLLGFQIWIGVDFFCFQIQAKNMVFSFTAIFPLVAAVLDVIAWRHVLTDEAMVRSSSRLRSMKKNGKLRK
ncbi:MAG: DUF4293 domain-containing protein [Bacteroidales bacterium]|nr:DUF4293 domain-containing protein [Bacteroidales bacterium]